LGCASLGAYLPDSESENISEHKIAGGAIGGVCAAGYAVMENVIRNDVKKVNKKILASLPFYVTFLPFRILSAAKKYFMTVEEEAEKNIENRRQVADITQITDAEYCEPDGDGG